MRSGTIGAEQADVGHEPLVLAELERENALLREELRYQWELNHFEWCSRDWPHPEDKTCYWPLPVLLRGSQ